MANIFKKFAENISAFGNLKASERKSKGDGIAAVLDFLDGQGLYPEFHTIESGVNEPEVTVNGQKYLMFCSNNYLALTQNELVKKAASDSIQKYGVGPGGSRVISGNIDIIEELESSIADLTHCEACLTFPTGYMANVAVFHALMDPLFFGLPYNSEDSVIFSDEFNHGSIVDGCRLSKAKKIVFKHNDLHDLANKIKRYDLPNKLIVTEGVFSLEGEIIDLPRYVQLAKSTGSKLMVDDAHGIGILGTTGGGTPELTGCQGEIDILMGSMDKALGGIGGYLCGKKNIIKFLKVASRSSILSSSYPTVMASAMLKAIEITKASENTRRELLEKAKYLSDNLKNMGFKILGKENLPAVALFTGPESTGIAFSRQLFESKIICPVFRWPAAPEGQSRLRITVMADHEKKQLDAMIEACKSIGLSLGMI